MEITQIINGQKNPVNTSLAKIQYEEVQVHDNLQDTGGGNLVDVDGKSSVLLFVTGDFNAKIFTHGSIDGSTFPEYERNFNDSAMLVYDFLNDNYVRVITKAGVYLVENLGYKKLRVRVNEYTSGSVSVLARVFVEPVAMGQLYNKQKPRIVRLAKLAGYSVNANTEVKAIDAMDCSDYVYLFVVSRSDSEHSRSIAFTFAFADGTLGATYGDVSAIDDSEQRSKSERIEPLSEIFNLWVTNKDSQAHTYDIFVYGVR